MDDTELTPEQLKILKRREYQRQRYHNLDPEKKLKKVENRKKWLQKQPDDIKDKYKEDHRNTSLQWYYKNQEQEQIKSRERMREKYGYNPSPKFQ